MGVKVFKEGERVVANRDVYRPVAMRGMILTILRRNGSRFYAIKEIEEHRQRDGGAIPMWDWNVSWKYLEHFPR